MKKILTVLILTFASASLFAQTTKPVNEKLSKKISSVVETKKDAHEKKDHSNCDKYHCEHKGYIAPCEEYNKDTYKVKTEADGSPFGYMLNPDYEGSDPHRKYILIEDYKAGLKAKREKLLEEHKYCDGYHCDDPACPKSRIDRNAKYEVLTEADGSPLGYMLDPDYKGNDPDDKYILIEDYKKECAAKEAKAAKKVKKSQK
ncbi:hypothetical protein Dip518_001556 [Parelusimicrobium proximum]|uniref:hypothetical protein n=1 Tax=Parelusimicrobium proximum TaxID=3228953 RepID=UPI003D176D58